MLRQRSHDSTVDRPIFAFQVALAAIVAFGFALRLYEARTLTFWFDESFSWRISQCSWSELVRRCASDNHSPLYFGLLKLWTGVAGTGTLALRAPSLLFGTATILVMYAVVARAIEGPRGRAAGLLTAFFVSVLLPAVSWSGTARMHALGMLLASASTLALLRALRHATPAAWALYGALAALAAYAHYYLFFFVLAQALYVAPIVLSGRISPLRPLLAAGVFTALWSPWIGVFLEQRAHTNASWWVPPLSVPMVVCSWYGLVAPRFQPGFPSAPFVLAVDLASVVALGRLAWRGHAHDRLFVLLGTLPFVAGVIASLHGANVLVMWYLVSSQLFLAAAAASMIMGIRRVVLRATAGAVAGAMLFGGFLADQRFEKLDVPYDRALARLADIRPGDEVVVDAFDYFPIRYLAPHSDLALYAQNGRLDFFAGGTMVTSDDRIVTQQQVEQLSSRSWVVDNMAMGTVAVPSSLKIRRQSTFGLLRVTEYEPVP